MNQCRYLPFPATLLALLFVLFHILDIINYSVQRAACKNLRSQDGLVRTLAFSLTLRASLQETFHPLRADNQNEKRFPRVLISSLYPGEVSLVSPSFYGGRKKWNRRNRKIFLDDEPTNGEMTRICRRNRSNLYSSGDFSSLILYATSPASLLQSPNPSSKTIAIRRLREETGASIKDCLKALQANGYDHDKSLEFILSTQESAGGDFVANLAPTPNGKEEFVMDSLLSGAGGGEEPNLVSDYSASGNLSASSFFSFNSSLSSKLNESFGAGVISLMSDERGSRGLLIEVGCKTDFVARNSVFLDLVESLAQELYNQSSLDELSLADSLLKCVKKSKKTAKTENSASGGDEKESIEEEDSEEETLVNDLRGDTVYFTSLFQLAARKLGEPLVFKRKHVLNTTSGNNTGTVIGCYLHGGNTRHTGQVGTLVMIKFFERGNGFEDATGSSDNVKNHGNEIVVKGLSNASGAENEGTPESWKLRKELADRIAMHVTAAKPSFLRIDDVPKQSLELKKQSIIEAQERIGKVKNEEILERIAEGKLQKIVQQVVLYEQEWMLDDSNMTVRQVLDEQAKRLGVVKIEVEEMHIFYS